MPIVTLQLGARVERQSVSGPNAASVGRARWLFRLVMFVAVISLGLMLGINSASADDGSDERDDNAGALGKTLRDVRETTEQTAQDGADAAGKARETTRQAATRDKPDRAPKAAASEGEQRAQTQSRDGQAQGRDTRNAAQESSESRPDEKRPDVTKQVTKTAQDVTRRAVPERQTEVEKAAEIAQPKSDRSQEVDHGRTGDSDAGPGAERQQAEPDVRKETDKAAKVAKQAEGSARTIVNDATSDQAGNQDSTDEPPTDSARSTSQDADRSATAKPAGKAAAEQTESQPEAENTQAAKSPSGGSRAEGADADTEVGALDETTEQVLGDVTRPAAETVGQVAATAEVVKEPVAQLGEAAPAAGLTRDLDPAPVVQKAKEATAGDVLDRTPVAPLVKHEPVARVLTETSAGGALEGGPLKALTDDPSTANILRQLSVADVVDRTPVSDAAEATPLAPILEPVLDQVVNRAVEDEVASLVDRSLDTTPQQLLNAPLGSVGDQLPGGVVPEKVRDLDVTGLTPGTDLWHEVAPVTETVAAVVAGERPVLVHDQQLAPALRTVSSAAPLVAPDASERPQPAKAMATAGTPAQQSAAAPDAPAWLDLTAPQTAELGWSSLIVEWPSDESATLAEQQAGDGSEPVADTVDAVDGSKDMNGSTPWSGTVPGGEVMMAPSGSASHAVALTPWAGQDFATDEVAINSFEELPTSAPQEPGFAPD